MIHNSALRDSHEYIKKQLWDERIFIRKCSKRFGKKTTGRQKILILSAMIPTYIKKPNKSELFDPDCFPDCLTSQSAGTGT